MTMATHEPFRGTPSTESSRSRATHALSERDLLGRQIWHNERRMADRKFSFSERMGFAEPRSVLQLDVVSEGLRNRLLNCFVKHRPKMETDHYRPSSFASAIADGFFKLSVAAMKPRDIETRITQLYAEDEWFRVYDFIEFVRGIRTWPLRDPRSFELACNEVLEEELSGYRFLNGMVVPVSSTEEMQAIDQALRNRVPATRQHLQRAVELLAARPEPNCAKSISESISAVEAMLQEITGDPKATLGRALTQLRPDTTFHPDLLEAFKKLYHWTSDDGGIRHAFKGQLPDRAITKFMLVSCSAFVNYLEELRVQIDDWRMGWSLTPPRSDSDGLTPWVSVAWANTKAFPARPTSARRSLAHQGLRNKEKG